MDILTAIRVISKWWFVVVPALALTIVASVAVHSAVSPSYKATGSVLLFFPSQIADPDTGRANSWLAFGNLTVPANVVTEIVSQDAVRQRLREDGATAAYELGIDPSSVTPLIVVVATGAQDEVTQTADRVIAQVDAVLEEQQRNAGAPESTWITTGVVTEPKEAVPESGSRIRAVAATLALGIGLSITVAFVLESLSQRRGPRHERDNGVTEGHDLTAATADNGAETCVLCGDAVLPEHLRDHLLERHGLQGDPQPQPSISAASSPADPIMGANVPAGRGPAQQRTW